MFGAKDIKQLVKMGQQLCWVEWIRFDDFLLWLKTAEKGNENE